MSKTNLEHALRMLAEDAHEVHISAQAYEIMTRLERVELFGTDDFNLHLTPLLDSLVKVFRALSYTDRKVAMQYLLERV